MDTERTRKNVAAIFQAIAKVGQNHIAERTGYSESKVSRLKSEGASMTVEDVARFLAACGLKVVPESMHCYRAESIQSLITLARERMAQIETPEQLTWE